MPKAAQTPPVEGEVRTRKPRTIVPPPMAAPTGAKDWHIKVWPARQAAFNTALGKLTSACGKEVSPYTLLDELLKDEALEAALARLAPKMERLKKLQEEQAALGLILG